jgi:hypothetical protein
MRKLPGAQQQAFAVMEALKAHHQRQLEQLRLQEQQRHDRLTVNSSNCPINPFLDNCSSLIPDIIRRHFQRNPVALASFLASTAETQFGTKNSSSQSSLGNPVTKLPLSSLITCTNASIPGMQSMTSTLSSSSVSHSNAPRGFPESSLPPMISPTGLSPYPALRHNHQHPPPSSSPPFSRHYPSPTSLISSPKKNNRHSEQSPILKKKRRNEESGLLSLSVGSSLPSTPSSNSTTSSPGENEEVLSEEGEELDQQRDENDHISREGEEQGSRKEVEENKKNKTTEAGIGKDVLAREQDSSSNVIPLNLHSESGREAGVNGIRTTERSHEGSSSLSVEEGVGVTSFTRPPLHHLRDDDQRKRMRTTPAITRDVISREEQLSNNPEEEEYHHQEAMLSTSHFSSEVTPSFSGEKRNLPSSCLETRRHNDDCHRPLLSSPQLSVHHHHQKEGVTPSPAMILPVPWFIPLPVPIPLFLFNDKLLDKIQEMTSILKKNIADKSSELESDDSLRQNKVLNKRELHDEEALEQTNNRRIEKNPGLETEDHQEDPSFITE